METNSPVDSAIHVPGRAAALRGQLDRLEGETVAFE
jgi:hypothetical protein